MKSPLECQHLEGTITGTLLSSRRQVYAEIMKVRLRIKEVAEAKGMSMTRLHTKSEVAYNTIRRLFRDPYVEVTTTTLARLAEALEVKVEDLIETVEDS